MSHTHLSSSKHHATLLAALPRRSPSISSQGDEDVILNQQGAPPPFLELPSYSRGAEATLSSQQQNLDPSVFFDAFIFKLLLASARTATTQPTALWVDREINIEVISSIGAVY